MGRDPLKDEGPRREAEGLPATGYQDIRLAVFQLEQLESLYDCRHLHVSPHPVGGVG